MTRANYTPALAKLVERADPVAEKIIEALVVDAEHVRCSVDQWEEADGWPVSGVSAMEDGSLRISGAADAAKISQATENGDFTLDSDWPRYGAMVEWKNQSDPFDLEITRIRAWLDNAAGNADEWICELYSITKVVDDDIVEMSRIGKAQVAAAATEGVVTFTFPASWRPRPKRIVPADPDNYGAYRFPTMLIFIYALDSNGATVTSNVGWGRHSTVGEQTTSLNTLKGCQFSQMVNPQNYGDFLVTEYLSTNCPYIYIDTRAFTQKTVEWTTSGTDTRFDLGAVPTGTVEFVLEGEERLDASLTGYVRNDADTAWVEFKDGDTTDDLTGVGKNRYYPIRIVLDPDSGGFITPVLRAIGVREITKRDLTDTVLMRNLRYTVDPVSGKAGIPEVTFEALRDGEYDFADAMTELLTEEYVGQVVLRVFLGHRTILTRDQWMKIEDFLIDDVVSHGGMIEVVGVSPLVRARTSLPKYDSSGTKREPLQYTSQYPKAVWQDLLNGQIEMPDRYRGNDVEDETYSISKIIKSGDAKDELDAVAFLAGGCAAPRQGRIGFIDLYSEKHAIDIFPSSEIMPITVTPGYKDRIPLFYVPFDYLVDENYYKKENRYVNTTALTVMQRAYVDAVEQLPDVIARWLITGSPSLPDLIGERMVYRFGPGMVFLAWRSTYAHWEREIGDMVSVQLDRFVGMDPNTDRAVKGHLWANAVLVEISDDARTFGAWVREYTDFFASSSAVTVTRMFRKYRCEVHHNSDQYCSPGTDADFNFDDENFDEAVMHDTATNNQRITVPVGGDGWYRAVGRVRCEVTTVFATPATAYISHQFYKNGNPGFPGAYGIQVSALGEKYEFEFSGQGYLVAGDYITLHRSTPSTGGTGAVTYYANDLVFRLERIGL